MSTAGTATPNGGQAITIPLDHKLVLVPNDHPDDGGTVEYPRVVQHAEYSASASEALAGATMDTEAAAEGVMALADRAEEQGRSPDAYAADGIIRVRDVRAAFAGVPKIRPQWVDRYMKILVVGESGMGKTTFIKNLFASYARDPDFKVASASTPTSREIFERNPQELCTEIVVEDETSQNRFHYRVQDTPGWEHVGDTMDVVMNFVKKCNEDCLAQEQDARRAGPMHKFDDPRVDVAVYFIAPHRLKQMDCQFMAELSKCVPVLPVLAKADTMTSGELAEYRREVRAALTHAGKQAGHDVIHKFSPESIKEAGPSHEVPPFALICSRTMDKTVGRFWPVRKYPWGTCEALSSEHSDFAALKKLLLETSFEELKEATERRYYRFREEELLNLTDPDTGRSFRPRFILNREPRRQDQPKLIKAAKVAGIVVGTYIAGAFLLGGRERLREDAHRAKELAEEAKETVVDVAVSAKEVIEAKVNPPPAPRKKVLGIF